MFASQLLSLHVLASTYGSGAYNSDVYNGSGAASGTLTNTGIALVGIATVATLITLTAIIVRIWKRAGKTLAEQEIIPKE